MSRDRAVYRLRRLSRAFGRGVTAAHRGGREHGRTRLTRLGLSLARSGFGTVELRHGRAEFPDSDTNVLRGRYRAGPPPTLELGPNGPVVRVAFAARESEEIGVLVPPEAVLLARERFPSSARNVLEATVISIARSLSGARLRLAVGDVRLSTDVTEETIGELELAPGRRVLLYIKATALRPLA